MSDSPITLRRYRCPGSPQGSLTRFLEYSRGDDQEDRQIKEIVLLEAA
jgi:hypothetical protein